MAAAAACVSVCVVCSEGVWATVSLGARWRWRRRASPAAPCRSTPPPALRPARTPPIAQPYRAPLTTTAAISTGPSVPDLAAATIATPPFHPPLLSTHPPPPFLPTVYLDNSSLELYHGRLDKRPNAIAVRIRWYGPDDPGDVYVERKTHKETWKVGPGGVV